MVVIYASSFAFSRDEAVTNRITLEQDAPRHKKRENWCAQPRHEIEHLQFWCYNSVSKLQDLGENSPNFIFKFSTTKPKWNSSNTLSMYKLIEKLQRYSRTWVRFA